MAKISYRSSFFQIIMVGFICFCVPGMFNALNAMGGGGQVDATTGSKANTALYTTFSVFGLLGGGIVNILGIRVTMFFSALTYALYSGSYIYLNDTGIGSFTIAAGAILGIGAGVLWAGQGMIMTSYPLEHEKGNYIFIFWSIFNLGAVIGSIIPTAINSPDPSLPNSGYIAFLVIEVFGSCLAFALAPPSTVVRSDGSAVIISKQDNVFGEFVEIIKLFANPKMLSLFFLSFSSNYFYTYQFNLYNSAHYTVNSRGFNNIFYWGSQMIGAYVYSLLLDSKRSRKSRAYIATTSVFILFNAIWVWTIFQHRNFGPVRDGTEHLYNFRITGSKYAGSVILYALMGFCDSAWQSLAYWLIGSFSNDSTILSRYVGFYKGVQSAGAAVSWGIDSAHVKPTPQLIINMVFLNVAIPFMYYICSKTTETSEVNPKLAYEESEV
ncbi:UNC93-like protein 2 [Smittium mucronatum]|uniref:UNC93-like protein 2 n=1 Tax=Smittium mucronatum TaxID=133383 RepID=A0A1R0GNJ7_9FUNG|nr:UNC93-like protein 2 [Smittium mucronatum]